jgi:phage terminase small subunit
VLFYFGGVDHVMAKLTPKQERFIDEYLIDLNATQAAIRAGYSKRSARQIAEKNMSKHDIRERIDKRLKEKENALIATQDEILKTLTRILRREEKITPLLPLNLVPLHLMTMVAI